VGCFDTVSKVTIDHHIGAPRPVLWDELTWEEVGELVEGGMDMAILPVGATEQHGRHLTVGMDTLAASTVAYGVSARTGVPVLPVLPYGCSLGHTHRWPGTISLRPETLSRMVVEIAEWLEPAGIRRLLLLNGHVTNHAPLRAALETVRHQQPSMLMALRSLWDISPRVHAIYHDDAVNFHANRAETALVMAVRPDLVRPDRFVDEPDAAVDHFFAYTVDRETATGTVGAPTLATAELGEELVEACVADLSADVRRALTEIAPLDTLALNRI
jgi:creatinine amidohydrolase